MDDDLVSENYQEKILITGGAIGDIEIILAAKELGYFVITSGNRPDDPGHIHSDLYVQADYTDVTALSRICISYDVCAIVPSAHDLAAIAAAEVAFELGLPGHDSPEISRQIHDKSSLRRLWARKGRRVPQFHSSTNLFSLIFYSMFLQMPLIIKPNGLTGGTGISTAANKYELLKSIQNAYRQPGGRGVIVEEFLKGTNHGLTCLLENQKIVFLANDDEFHIYDPFRVSATTFPSSHSLCNISSLINEIENFAHEMKLVNGIFHTQFLMTDSGPILLEACRRTPGDAYTKFVSEAYSFDYAKDIVLGFAGRTLNSYLNSRELRKGVFIGRFILMPNKSGIFEQVLSSKFPNLLWKSNFRKSGEAIDDHRRWTAQIFIFESSDERLDENYYRNLANVTRVLVR